MPLIRSQQFLPFCVLALVACGAQLPAEDPAPQTSPTAKLLVEEDIVYSETGESSAYTSLDVYRYSGWKNVPVLIFVHGGGWVGGDKSNLHMAPSFVDHFLAKGYAVVAINHRLQGPMTSNTYVEQATDIASAVAWVHGNHERIGIDPERMALMGYSSGAHLVALVGTDPSYLQAYELVPPDLAAIISLDVIAYDIPRAIEEACDHDFCPTARNLPVIFGAAESPQLAASPIHHVGPQALPAFLIVSAGSKDGIRHTLSHAQSSYFVQTLRSAGAAAEHYHDKDESHTSLVRNYGENDDQVTREVEAFLDARIPR